MAEEHHNKSSHEYETAVVDHDRQEDAVESKDRGMFDFLGKKEEEKPQEEVIVTDFEEKVTVSEVPEPKVEKEEYKEEEKKHESLLEKLHRSNSSSSSSSDEEEGEGEGKKKKKKEKKGLKDKITGDKKEEKHEDTSVPIERYEEDQVAAAPVHHSAEPIQPEEKKGFLDKIKEKLPGQQKKTEEVHPPPPPPPQAEYHAEAAEPHSHEGEGKEKKGFLEKIKEKLPGYHPKTEEEKEKESASH